MKNVGFDLYRGLLLCLTLTATLFVSNQACASTPYFENQILTIPRIDVEGYGALNVTFKLLDADALTFSILAAVAADASVAPGGTFSLSSGVLDLPMVRVDGNFYDVQMQLKPGDTFQLIGADDVVFAGLEDFQNQCAGCHGDDGLGGTQPVPLVDCSRCGDINTLSDYIADSMPLGNSSNCTDTCASDIAAFVAAVFNSGSGPVATQALLAVDFLPLQDTLNNASLELLSRLPTAAEIAEVNNNGEAGLRSVLDGMMQEPAFYQRLSEIFNDVLLTQRYNSINGVRAALNLMRGYPNAYWFDDGSGSDEVRQLQVITNNSIAAGPLELINYVVKNDLPMSEILTADYMMVNGYSAKSYGVYQNLSFNDEWDPSEFVPARLDDIPHAGLLTSLMFMNRYPTSNTNRNRGRARVVYDLFLDVNILALDGQRPNGSAVDIVNDSPTMENPDCVLCHSLLDPVASSFRNWNRTGRYQASRRWYDDMFQAGFSGTALPTAEVPTSLQWLAAELAQDPRFDDGMVRIVYRGLTGREPLDPPGQSATAAAREAYIAESNLLKEIKSIFSTSNRNLKTLVTEIILSPYWRAESLNDQSFAVVHENTGSANLLTPEQLHRKITALLGFEWRTPLNTYAISSQNAGSARLLNKNAYYQQIYGGIDSFNVIDRLVEPNGLMVKVQERMANELACYAVPNDFLALADKRLLFPSVATSTLPGSGDAAIMTNIQHLHQHLLGETLDLTDPELLTTYQLFTEVLAAGQANIGSTETTALPQRCMRNLDMVTGEVLVAGDGSDGRLRQDPNFVIRAWMAVVSYLLSDYRFLYQ